MTIRFTVRGQRRAVIVDTWWRGHRQDAPELFKEELAHAQARLLENPQAGIPFIRLRGRLFRRVLLRRTRQWIYYRVVEGRALIVIHSVGVPNVDATLRCHSWFLWRRPRVSRRGRTRGS